MFLEKNIRGLPTLIVAAGSEEGNRNRQKWLPASHSGSCCTLTETLIPYERRQELASFQNIGKNRIPRKARGNARRFNRINGMIQDHLPDHRPGT
jgi:hypothetical protein